LLSSVNENNRRNYEEIKPTSPLSIFWNTSLKLLEELREKLLFLMACMMLPIQFRFGAEKSRTAYFIVIGGLAVLLFIVFKLIGSGDGSIDIIETALSFLLSPVGIITVTAVFLILVAVSYLLSVRIMEKKEF
ncbi:MAG: ABC-2 transporter permease, partial [Clostridia bacterium]|nr:ABC-2 transporter permease [Clostridia bacterium]